MRTKLLLLTLAFFIQGCTVIGVIIDSKHPTKNKYDKSKTFTEMGLEADTRIMKSVKNDQPLIGNGPKNEVICEELKGKKLAECYKALNQSDENL